ncbi:MAG: hypothetical protein GC154_20960 [bacterium]|nr:hypothetical protein [bacterium]
MKSAYELAMERLEKENPSGPKLGDEQKKELAEIDNRYQAKIAERRILAENERKQAASHSELEEIEARAREDVRRLEAERDEKKDAVRQGGPA